VLAVLPFRPAWLVLAHATGDLTNDGRKNAVVILTPNPANAPEDFDEQRLLVVLVGTLSDTGSVPPAPEPFSIDIKTASSATYSNP